MARGHRRSCAWKVPLMLTSRVTTATQLFCYLWKVRSVEVSAKMTCSTRTALSSTICLSRDYSSSEDSKRVYFGSHGTVIIVKVSGLVGLKYF